MFIGKWNKSVIITYVGVAFSAFGMWLALNSQFRLAMCCMLAAGVCDLFDGAFARSCERTDEEMEFGKQIDSLADVTNFIAFPIVAFMVRGLTKPFFIPLSALFAICGTARLAHFNINSGSDKPVKYYTGLPVTTAAFFFPIIYFLSFFIKSNVFTLVLALCVTLVSFLNISKIKIKKPHGTAYAVFTILAAGVVITYLAVL